MCVFFKKSSDVKRADRILKLKTTINPFSVKNTTRKVYFSVLNIFRPLILQILNKFNLEGLKIMYLKRKNTISLFTLLLIGNV